MWLPRARTGVQSLPMPPLHLERRALSRTVLKMSPRSSLTVVR
jgi:hypothetical protein